MKNNLFSKLYIQKNRIQSMRKIQTAQEIERKKKRNNLILVIIMVALIGFSSLGYAIMNREDGDQTDSSVVYGGLKFIKSGGYWTTEINSKVFYFNYLPLELENVSIIGNYSFENYYQQPVYIINLNPAVNGLMYALDGIAMRIQEACIYGEYCSNKDLPIKTCEDNVIVFKNANSNITKITKSQNCVFIEGNFFEGTDKLVYKMLNIA